MEKTRLAVSIIQILIAAFGAAVAAGLIPANAELIALLLALQNAFAGAKNGAKATHLSGNGS